MKTSHFKPKWYINKNEFSIKGEVGAVKTVIFINDRSKATLFLWILFVVMFHFCLFIILSCVFLAAL